MTSQDTSHKRNFMPRVMPHDIQALKSRSQAIGRLKYGLPGIALAILAILVAWPQGQKWMQRARPALAQTTLAQQTHNTAIHPEYKSTDKKGQPYTLTADHGVETSIEEIDLTRPKMVMNLTSGEAVTLASNLGKFNKGTNIVHLTGNVTLIHSQGYALQTTQAWIDCNEGNAFGNDPTWGNGPTGAIEARGFRLTERGAKVSFIGGTQLLVVSGGEKGNKQE